MTWIRINELCYIWVNWGHWKIKYMSKALMHIDWLLMGVSHYLLREDGPQVSSWRI